MYSRVVVVFCLLAERVGLAGDKKANDQAEETQDGTEYLNNQNLDKST